MIIQSTHVWIDDCLQPAQLEIADGLIQAVLPYGEKQPDHDYQELWILPGFIDIHMHEEDFLKEGKEYVIAEHMLEMGGIKCPNCGEELEFDAIDDEEE